MLLWMTTIDVVQLLEKLTIVKLSRMGGDQVRQLFDANDACTSIEGRSHLSPPSWTTVDFLIVSTINY